MTRWTQTLVVVFICLALERRRLGGTETKGFFFSSQVLPAFRDNRDDVQRHGRVEADMNIPRQTFSDRGMCRIQGRDQSALPMGRQKGASDRKPGHRECVWGVWGGWGGVLEKKIDT